MYKQITLFFIFLILITNAYSQFIPNPFEEPLRNEYLKKRNEAINKADKIKIKKIKSVTEFSTSDYPWYNYTEYDKDGYVVLKSLISKQTKEESSVGLVYDFQKNVITQYGEKYELIKTRAAEYKYDDNNNLVEKIEFTISNNSIVYEYKYDVQNNLSEIMETSSSVNYGYKIHYKLNYNNTKENLIVTYNLVLDNTDDKIAKEFIDSYRGKAPVSITYKFDSNNNIIYKLIKKIVTEGINNSYGESSELILYTYDKNNKLLEYSFSGTSDKIKESYIYNKNGVMIKSLYELDKGYKETSFYDENGKISKVEYVSPLLENENGKGVRIYKYDIKDNLIQINENYDDKYFHKENTTSYTYEFY